MRVRKDLNALEKEDTPTRPQRVPVSGNRDILAVKNIPEGKIGRWVNDKEDRLLRFQQGGWEFVTDLGVTVGERTVEASKEVGSVVKRLVGTKPSNEPLYAYLMVIAKEWYNEDQARKQEEVSKNEEGIYEMIKSKNNYVKELTSTFGNVDS